MTRSTVSSSVASASPPGRIRHVRVGALLGLAACAAHAQTDALDRAQLSQWLSGYEAAWETKDADAAADLFTPDARYYETPYDEPFVGQEGIAEYWENVTSGQRDIDFEADIVAIEGNTGVARWNAVFLAGPDDMRVELDGVFVLEFDDDGRCTELREWWHMR